MSEINWAAKKTKTKYGAIVAIASVIARVTSSLFLKVFAPYP